MSKIIHFFKKKNIKPFPFIRQTGMMECGTTSLAYNRYYQSVEDYKIQVISINKMINSLKTEISKFTTENYKLTTNYEAITFDLTSEIDNLKSKIRNIYGDFQISDDGLYLISDRKGQITYIKTSDWQIDAQAVIVKILPQNRIQEIVCLIPPHKIGQIQSKAKASIQIAIFPTYTWGTLQGYVKNYSQTPDENGNYLATIIIKDYGKLAPMIRPSMQGTAYIIYENKTLLGYLVSTVKQKYDSSINT